MKMINNLKSLFTKSELKEFETKEFCFNIGISSEILTTRRGYTLRYNGRYMEIVGGSPPQWRKFVKDIVIKPHFEPNPHILIVGMSGFGKSTLFKSMIIDIKNFGGNAIIFDAHGEHEELVAGLSGKAYDAGISGINIFELCGVTIAERIADLTQLFKSVYGLGHIQATKLSSCMWYTYRRLGAASKNDTILKKTPIVTDLLHEISIFIKGAKTATEINTLEHLRARISLLNSASFGKNSLAMNEIKSGISSFTLANLKSSEAQIIYINELLKRLYSTMKQNQKESGIKLYIMLDEAQFLIRSSESGAEVISKLISEGRKYGVGVVIATHLSNVLDKRIVANAATFITFYARDPTEIDYLARLFSGGDQQTAVMIKLKLRKMKKNCAMVISGQNKEPFVVDTPRFDEVGKNIPKGFEGNAGRILAAAVNPVLIESLDHFGRKNVERLVEQKELDSISISNDDKKELWVMKWNGAHSVEHEVYVRKIGSFLLDSGFKCYILNNWVGPDAVVHRNGEKYAIEYETGKKLTGETRKMFDARLKKFDRVFVVVNDARFESYRVNFSSDRLVVLRASELVKLATLMG